MRGKLAPFSKQQNPALKKSQSQENPDFDFYN
jgi:hypothetical protein